MEIYHINLRYSGSQSLYIITALVESVQGVKIQHMRFTSNGTNFIGLLIVQTSNTLQFQSVLKLMKSSKVCYLVEGYGHQLLENYIGN